jgi:hypothetical protein
MRSEIELTVTGGVVDQSPYHDLTFSVRPLTAAMVVQHTEFVCLFDSIRLFTVTV